MYQTINAGVLFGGLELRNHLLILMSFFTPEVYQSKWTIKI